MTAPVDHFISAFFVPLFLADSNGDIALVRLAASQTMNAYRIKHHADLITAAQIVAFIKVAEEYTAELPHLPPDEQRAASICVAALNSSASALLAGVDKPALAFASRRGREALRGLIP